MDEQKGTCTVCGAVDVAVNAEGKCAGCSGVAAPETPTEPTTGDAGGDQPAV